MKNLNGTFARSYKKNGKDIFVYHVTGSAEATAKYKEIQGEFYREDETSKHGLYFSTRYVGDNVKLLITEKGNVVPDMSEYAKAASLASQFGGNLGQELARNAAAKLMGTPVNNDVVAPVNIQANPADLEQA